MENDVAVIYSKTALGEQAEFAMDDALSTEMLRALTLIDGQSTLDELLAKLPSHSGSWLGAALTELVRGGYVELVEGSPDELTADAGEIETQADTETEGEGDEEAKAKLRSRAQRRLAARAREEAERLVREEAERKDREEAERLAREKAEREAQEEAERLKREEDARIVREEAERIAREEAERIARVAAERQAREESERKAREEAERKAREEAERQVRAEAERQARLDAERQAEEERARRIREEAERQAREEAEAEERERAEIEARARAFVEARAKEEENKVQKPVYMVRRPTPWGTMVLGTVATLVLVPLVLLHMMSLSMLSPTFEKLASDTMGEPVAVGSVHASLWPTPHFKLENIAIGPARDIKLATVRVMPEVASLFGDAKVIRVIEVESLVLDQDSLGRATQWLARIDPKQLRLGRLDLKNVKVEVKGLELPPFRAEVQVGEEGGFKRVHLRTLDRKLEVEVEPKGTDYAVNVRADHWQPPVGAPLMFDELSLKATASREGMKSDEITARLYGGMAKGNAVVRWGEQWAAEGGFDLENMELAAATEVFTSDIALSGRLNANATYALQARELAELFEAPKIQASFNSRDGAIGTLDFAHALQSRAREYVGNGKTGYANWSGSLVVEGNRYRYSQMKLDAGLLHASGEADIAPNKDLSGRASVEMQMKSAPMRARFAVSGSLTRLVLRRAD